MRKILLAAVLVILVDVAAAFLVPPLPNAETGTFSFPGDAITANIEPPAPHVVLDLAPGEPAEGMLQFHPSISSSILTSWIVMAIVLVAMIALTRGLKVIPGRAQNFVEFLYEFLEGFAKDMGGPAAARYVPLFASLFLFIICSNWIGLIPPVGKLEFLRAPSSDLNITAGLALVSFVTFHTQGVMRLGVVGYLAKFFPLGEFRHGIGAGVIALFVGLVELLLEFVKPLTLSMRLFGNIFGGEVALGVLTGLTIALVPVMMMGLELLLNAVQALIFSVLTLMFTLAAIEGHHSEGAGHELEPHALPVPDVEVDVDVHHLPAQPASH